MPAHLIDSHENLSIVPFSRPTRAVVQSANNCAWATQSRAKSYSGTGIGPVVSGRDALERFVMLRAATKSGG